MSGKKAKTKRKVEAKRKITKAIESVAKGEAPKLEMEPEVKLIKLDLGAGQNPREGFEGVDLCEGSKHRVNLFRFPWPFDTSSVDEIHTSHFLEHVPMEQVDDSGLPVNPGEGQDLLFKLMDECYRILKPNGVITIIVPNARSNRGFQDPTHRRFFVAETFLYFFKEWRAVNKLDHYNVKCNFGSVGDGQPDVAPIIPIEANAWAPEVQQRRFTGEWNVIMDWMARLKALK